MASATEQDRVRELQRALYRAAKADPGRRFRARRSAHDALQVLIDETWEGRRWVVETDVASCFEAIPHDRLVAAVEERICDRKLLKLMRALLRAGVMEQG